MTDSERRLHRSEQALTGTDLTAAHGVQRLLHEAIGQEERADAFLHPVIVRELSADEARRLWPDFEDTQLMEFDDEKR